MARAADVFRIACPHCRTARVLVSDGRGSHPPVGAFAVHDCFACELAADAIAQVIARDGLPRDAEPSDRGALAQRHYAEELARCERTSGPASWPAIRCRIALARNLESSGEPDALAHLRRAAALYPGRDPDHPDWFVLFAALGYRLKATGHDDVEARNAYARLHELYLRALGPTHLLVADCCRIVGELACRTGSYAGARAFFERELELWKTATDEAIARYRAGNRTVPPQVAGTTYALYPLHRDSSEDYRAHQLAGARAKLAQAVLGLGGDPACVLEDDVQSAALVGDFLFYTDKAFVAARRLYEVAVASTAEDDPVIHALRAKLEMARALAP